MDAEGDDLLGGLGGSEEGDGVKVEHDGSEVRQPSPPEVLGAAGARGSAEWDIGTWLGGFEGESIHGAVANVLRRSKPESTSNAGRSEYEWCRELAGKAEQEPGLIASMLGTALVEQVSAVLRKHLHALREQVLQFPFDVFHCRAPREGAPTRRRECWGWRWRCSYRHLPILLWDLGFDA